MALELAEHDANVSWEYLKTAPQIATALPMDQWPAWLDIGLEMTRLEPVVGLEYIRQIPALVPVLGAPDVRQWLVFGMKLIMPNSLGKPDYDGILANEPSSFERHRSAAALFCHFSGRAVGRTGPGDWHRLAR
jgi:hypothetical protein